MTKMKPGEIIAGLFLMWAAATCLHGWVVFGTYSPLNLVAPIMVYGPIVGWIWASWFVRAKAVAPAPAWTVRIFAAVFAVAAFFAFMPGSVDLVLTLVIYALLVAFHSRKDRGNIRKNALKATLSATVLNVVGLALAFGRSENIDSLGVAMFVISALGINFPIIVLLAWMHRKGILSAFSKGAPDAGNEAPKESR